MTEEHKEVAENLPGTDGAPERLSREDMLDQLQVRARQIAGDAPPRTARGQCGGGYYEQHRQRRDRGR
jgi:hypothetical protein